MIPGTPVSCHQPFSQYSLLLICAGSKILCPVPCNNFYPKHQSLKHLVGPLSSSFKTCELMELLWAVGQEALFNWLEIWLHLFFFFSSFGASIVCLSIPTKRLIIPIPSKNTAFPLEVEYVHTNKVPGNEKHYKCKILLSLYNSTGLLQLQATLLKSVNISFWESPFAL